MTQTIDIRPQDEAIVSKILKFYLPEDAKVWVFGSRATGKARRASDLDLAIDCGQKLTLEQRDDLKAAFTLSLLPYTVDIVDMHTVSDHFKAIIERDMVPFM